MYQKILQILLLNVVSFSTNNKPENDENKSMEVMELWNKMSKNSIINFDEFDNNFFDILDMDTNEEFPFVLFILVSRGDNRIDYAQLRNSLNNEVMSFINLQQNNKTGYKVLIVIVPIDNQTLWKDHYLYNTVAIPNALPTFLLMCRQKQCKVCKNQKFLKLINVFYGVFEPTTLWFRSLLYNKISIGNHLKKNIFPYEQMGIITMILSHFFKKK